MTRDELDHAIAGLEAAIANEARLLGLLGVSGVRGNRDIKLGLTSEQSKPVLEAILAALRALPA